jgi:UDP-N-acetylmuramoyl-tripeptide--D-alanyl-D-alanine ligase
LRGFEQRRMNLSIKEIADRFARWASLALVPAESLQGISTDSRRISAGELFVAIKGDNFDGHQFVRAALDKGAAAVLVDQAWFTENAQKFANDPLLVTNDTLVAYQNIAHFYKNKMNPRVVALTGSAGKTTCKEFIYAVLAQKWRVLRNIKSFNNHIGVPATLLQLEPEHEILVAELGASDFGEIERLSELVQPDVCVLLNIGYAHLENFKNRIGVAKAKMEIFAHASQDALAIINADDEILAQQDYPGADVITFGVDPTADVVAENIACDELGRYSFYLGEMQIHLRIPGRHNIYNALAAAAAGIQFDVPMAKIKAAIESVDFVEHRMNVTNAKGKIIFDDVYNANPGSCRAALETAADIQIVDGARRIAVLGDMLELGELSELEHRNLAEAVKENSIDALFLYGSFTNATAARASELGLVVNHFQDQIELINELESFSAENDLILVKGSRSMHMEHIVDALKDD